MERVVLQMKDIELNENNHLSERIKKATDRFHRACIEEKEKYEYNL